MPSPIKRITFLAARAEEDSILDCKADSRDSTFTTVEQAIASRDRKTPVPAIIRSTLGSAILDPLTPASSIHPVSYTPFFDVSR
jgi:hypothetical protein